MRIAIVHGFYSSDAPSGENAVVQMQLHALNAGGHDARLFAVYTDDFRQNAFYKVKTAVHVATGLGHNPSQALLEFEPDIIHVHNLFPNFSTRWLSDWAGAIVVSLHNFRPLCASGNLFRDGGPCSLCPSRGQIHGILHKCYKDSALATLPLAIRNRGGVVRDPLLSRADKIIFLSERARQTYSDFGLDLCKSRIIPNFVEATHENLEAAPAGASWVFAGRLSSDKGIVRLVEAWPNDVRLDIFGDGPEMDFLKNLGHPSVKLHGAVAREVVLHAVSEARGVVIPSLWAEGLPTIYLEALAAGIPVMVKAGNSAADDVLVSNAGVVFNDWSEVTHLAATFAEKRQEYGEAASLRFAEHFTKAAWLSRIEEVYRDALVSKPPQPCTVSNSAGPVIDGTS